MTYRIHRQFRNSPFLVLVSPIFLSGCNLNWPALQWPANLSKEITFVMENNARFSQDSADPLKNVAPGEVRDDLSRLSGCWGAFYDSAFVIPFLGYETYSFDPSLGKFRYHVFQTPSAYCEEIADYVVTSANTISLRNITRTCSGTETSFLTEGPITVMLTVESDRMRIAYQSMEGNFLNGGAGMPDDLRVPLVFKAFDCPQ